MDCNNEDRLQNAASRIVPFTFEAWIGHVNLYRIALSVNGYVFRVCIGIQLRA